MQSGKPKVGQIVWRDLTVTNAEEVKNFYSSVIGWKSQNHDMGDYHDFEIQTPEDEEVVAGVCHARGSNKNIPPQWLMYVYVESVQESAEACLKSGGEVVDGPRKMGTDDFCIIKDPAGAVLGLISSSSTNF